MMREISEGSLVLEWVWKAVFLTGQRRGEAYHENSRARARWSGVGQRRGVQFATRRPTLGADA